MVSLTAGQIPEADQAAGKQPQQQQQQGPPALGTVLEAGGSAASSSSPRDAKIVEAVLRSNGIENFDVEVVPMLMEFTQRYIAEVLEESMYYMDHRTKGSEKATSAAQRQQQLEAQQLNEADLALAVKSRISFGWAQSAPREMLLELSHARNSVPLASMTDVTERDGLGLKLPGEQDTLLQPNWKIH